MKAIILFFALLFATSFTVQAEVSWDSSGWYPVGGPLDSMDATEAEREVRKYFTHRLERCMGELPDDLRKGGRSRIFTTVYDATNGAARLIGTKEEMEVPTDDAIEVVLHGALSYEQLPSSFFYFEDWNAVFVPAVRMTDGWLCTAFTHEFLHARAHFERRDRGESTPQTREDVLLEEIAIHEIERMLIDVRTQGRYVAAIQAAVDTHADDEHAWLTQLHQMIQAVNRTFPAAESDVEQAIREAQIQFDLFFFRLERGRCAVDDQKIALYDALRRNSR